MCMYKSIYVYMHVSTCVCVYVLIDLNSLNGALK